MTDYVSSSGDGLVQSTVNNNYTTARTTSGSFNITSSNSKIGQYRTDAPAGDYTLWRLFLKFDTSSIPTYAVINSVKLRLTMESDRSTTDFDVQIVKQDWSSQDPIAAGTREAAYDGCLSGTADDSIWKNTNGLSVNTPYESGELSKTWVNKGGTTYYSLRSSLDYAGTAPSASASGNEDISIYMSEETTSAYKPYLVVTFTVNYRKLLMSVHAHA